MLTIV
jgi:hypothetical protein